jgi:hypothetical protein
MYNINKSLPIVLGITVGHNESVEKIGICILQLRICQTDGCVSISLSIQHVVQNKIEQATAVKIKIKDKNLLFVGPSMPKAPLCINPIGHTACCMSYRVGPSGHKGLI